MQEAVSNHTLPRRAMLLGAAVLPGAAVAAPLALTPNPDAELIALCARHPALIAAFNTSDGDGSDSDPAWTAYAASRDDIHDARSSDGREEYRSSAAGSWS